MTRKRQYFTPGKQDHLMSLTKEKNNNKQNTWETKLNLLIFLSSLRLYESLLTQLDLIQYVAIQQAKLAVLKSEQLALFEFCITYSNIHL